MKRIIFILTLTVAVPFFTSSSWADQVTGLTTFTSGTPAVAASVNSNFAEIRDSVNDNDTRVTALEGVRRSFWLPAPYGSGLLGGLALTDGVSSYYLWSFSAPSDYVSGGSSDVDYSIVFYGGDNCDFRYTSTRYGRSFGFTGNIFPIATIFTVSIPDIGAGNYFTNLSSTRTGFNEINYVTFTRQGADAADTCTGDLFLLGLNVEYPAGQ